MDQQYLNEKQVSQQYGWALSTLRNWRFMGRGPKYMKIYKSVRYKIADLEDFMSRHKVDPEMRHAQ